MWMGYLRWEYESCGWVGWRGGGYWMSGANNLIDVK